MKKLLVMAASAALLSISYAANAQEKKDDTSMGDHVKHDAKKVGDKTAEIATKGESKVVDKTYEGKVGPGEQTIYIDKHSKYYYVDGTGKKIYVSKMELKDKKKD